MDKKIKYREKYYTYIKKISLYYILKKISYSDKQKLKVYKLKKERLIGYNILYFIT